MARAPPTRPRGSSRVRSSSPGRASPRSRDRTVDRDGPDRPGPRDDPGGEEPAPARDRPHRPNARRGGARVCVLIVVFYARSRGNLLEGLLAGLAVAMSVLPEEFPVVLTVFLALGAWRISRQRVLTRRIPAVEALGAATVLCVDKTGTLTLNRMAVARLVAADRPLEVDGSAALPDAFHELVEFAILASQRTPFDPMEQAIREFGLSRAGADRAPSRGLGAPPRVSPVAGAPGRVARVEGARARTVRHRGEGRPRGHRGPLPPPRERDSPPHLARRGARPRRAARPRRREGRLRAVGAAAPLPRFLVRAPRARRPRRSASSFGAGGDRGLPGRPGSVS